MMERLPEPQPKIEFGMQGVFAARDITKGEILERSPVIPIPAEEWGLVSQTVLRFYAYAWGDTHSDAAIALGWGSLFRSTPGEPSAHYENHLEDWVIEFFAARDIARGEEITVRR